MAWRAAIPRGARGLANYRAGSSQKRYDGRPPGADLPPLEITTGDLRSVAFQYGVILGNIGMLAYVSYWVYHRFSWAKDPGS